MALDSGYKDGGNAKTMFARFKKKYIAESSADVAGGGSEENKGEHSNAVGASNGKKRPAPRGKKGQATEAATVEDFAEKKDASTGVANAKSGGRGKKGAAAAAKVKKEDSGESGDDTEPEAKPGPAKKQKTATASAAATKEGDKTTAAGAKKAGANKKGTAANKKKEPAKSKAKSCTNSELSEPDEETKDALKEFEYPKSDDHEHESDKKSGDMKLATRAGSTSTGAAKKSAKSAVGAGGKGKGAAADEVKKTATTTATKAGTASAKGSAAKDKKKKSLATSNDGQRHDPVQSMAVDHPGPATRASSKAPTPSNGDVPVAGDETKTTPFTETRGRKKGTASGAAALRKSEAIVEEITEDEGAKEGLKGSKGKLGNWKGGELDREDLA